MALSKKDQ